MFQSKNVSNYPVNKEFALKLYEELVLETFCKVPYPLSLLLTFEISEVQSQYFQLKAQGYLLECKLLLVINPKVSCIPMEKTSHVNTCDSRVHAYKNGKTMEQCKEEARKNTLLLSKELLENGVVSWTRVLDMAGHDELVYKLTLKYLRQQGYDIGNNKIPRVRPNTGL